MNETLPKRSSRMVSGVSAIAGVLMLVLSFAINYGPPLGSGDEAFARFVHDSYAAILWGAWLQAVGPVFIVFFAFSLVHLAGQASRVAGWMTFFGATVLMMVSLIEITFYISALYPAPKAMTPISFEMIYAVQHLYFVVAAPALFLPLGWVLLQADVLPRFFGVSAVVLGSAFAIVGVASLLTLTLPASITSLGSVQAVWWLAAGLALMTRKQNGNGGLSAQHASHSGTFREDALSVDEG
ncbi:hypothetical protein DYQ86_06465 [Acidobacteria bacterium AB60]|nr:hypothetical protein DYQ86_06465 [Acidobacteria bacterium AB60]